MTISSYAAHAAGFQLGRAVLRLGVDSTGMSSGLRQAQGRFERFAVLSQAAGRTAGIALSAPLFAAGVLALKVSAEYEHTMKRVQAVSGASGKHLEALKKQTVDLAETTKFTMRQVGDAQVFLAMAGLQVNTILKAMPSVLNLAAASGLELARVADLLTNIMTAFQISADKTVEVMDVLTITFTGSNTSMTQLADALRYVSPSVASLGHTVSETAAAIGILGNQGIQASLAGTYMRAVFRELARPAGQLKKTIDQLGLSTRNMSGEIVTAAEMVEEFERVQASAADAARGFGRRGGTGAAALVAAGSDEIRRMQSLHRLALTSTKEVAETMLDTLIGDLAILRAKVETFLESVAQSGLGQFVRSTVQLMQRLFDRLNDLSAESMNAILAVSAVLIVLPPTLLLISSGLLLVIRQFRAWSVEASGVAASMRAVAAASAAATTAAGAGRAAAASMIVAPVGAGLGGGRKATGGLAIGGFGGKLRDTSTGRFTSGAGQATQRVAQSAARATKALTVMQRAGTLAFSGIAWAARGLAALLWNPITGVLVAMYALGKWTMKKAEDSFRAAEVAALSYAGVLDEIRRVEEKLAQTRKPEEKTLYRGMPGERTVYVRSVDQLREEKLALEEMEALQARHGRAQREQYVEEATGYDELRAAVTRARNDLRSGKISFEQYVSDLRTVSEEGGRLMEESLLFEKDVIGRLVASTDELRERGEKELAPFWRAMEGVGRNLNALQDSILRGDLTREAGESVLVQAEAQLDRLIAAMDPAAAEMFAGWMGTLRSRIADLAPDVTALVREVRELADAYLETTRLDPREMLINIREVPLGEGFGGFSRAQLSNIAPGRTEAQQAGQQFAAEWMAANRKAMAAAANRQEMRAMFSDFGRDLGARFARAIVEGSDTLAEDFRKALTAEGMQRIFTKAGEKLGNLLADEVSKVLTASQAGWVATIASVALFLKSIGDSQSARATAAQEGQRTDYGSALAEMSALYEQLTDDQQAQVGALRDSFPHLSGYARLMAIVNAQIELATELMQEFGSAADQADDAVRDLQGEWRTLANEMMRAGEYTEEFLDFIWDHVDIQKYREELEALAVAVGQLRDLRASLEFLGELGGAITEFLPQTDLERLIETGEVTGRLLWQFEQAGGEAGALRKFGFALSDLRQFESLIEQFRETGEVIEDLDAIVLSLTGTSLKDLQDRIEHIQGLLNFGEEALGLLQEYLPETLSPLESFFATGALDPAVVDMLTEMGVSLETIDAFAEKRALLSEFDQINQVLEETGSLTAGIREQYLGLVQELRASAGTSDWADNLRDLYSFLDKQGLEAAGGILGSLSGHEFAFEALEYQLKGDQDGAAQILADGREDLLNSVQEMAQTLHEEITESMTTLEEQLGSYTASLEEAILQASNILRSTVESVAGVLQQQIQSLAQTVQQSIQALENTIQGLIEQLSEGIQITVDVQQGPRPDDAIPLPPPEAVAPPPEAVAPLPGQVVAENDYWFRHTEEQYNQILRYMELMTGFNTNNALPWGEEADALITQSEDLQNYLTLAFNLFSRFPFLQDPSILKELAQFSINFDRQSQMLEWFSPAGKEYEQAPTQAGVDALLAIIDRYKINPPPPPPGLPPPPPTPPPEPPPHYNEEPSRPTGTHQVNLEIHLDGGGLTPDEVVDVMVDALESNRKGFGDRIRDGV